MPLKQSKRLIQPLQILKSLGPDKPQTSPLATIPVELVVEVLQYLDLGTQIALALTSQRLLRIFASTELKINALKGQSVSLHQRQLTKAIRQIQPRVVTAASAVELHARWHFCDGCVMLRPMKMAYWKRKLKSWDISEYFYHAWRYGLEQKLICPECKAEMLGLEPSQKGHKNS
ncbi:hypothetical protein BDW42DRAFT_191285 [Aspergillus taichungensis]|uniref:F-box domain-containing protein n=1 Tax=Aspergillus taichungensis TaxID=482145 RepID=A0A2J5I4T1_9EURO|nr:hypothetical protein BDW42DRAFT_191285 [Aspergillus taichungensis]